MAIKNNSSSEGITLESVVNSAITWGIKDSKMIVIRKGTKEQIDKVSKEIISKFKEKHPTYKFFIMSEIKENLNFENLKWSNTYVILKDYYNKLDLEKNRDLYYEIDIKGCFGYNLPQ